MFKPKKESLADTRLNNLNARISQSDLKEHFENLYGSNKGDFKGDFNYLTTSEISSVRAEIESGLEQKKNLSERRRSKILFIAAIVYLLCAGFYFLGVSVENIWVTGAAVFLGALSSGAASGYALFEAFKKSIDLKSLVAPSAAVLYFYGGILVSDLLGWIAFFAMMLSYMVASIIVSHESDVVDKLEEQLKLMTEISPREHPKLCTLFAKWIELKEPFALELYKNLDKRRPIVGEIKALEYGIGLKTTEIKKAEEDCKRLFGGMEQ